MNSMTQCTTCGGGESGAGAPAVRPQNVEVRVEESQFGGATQQHVEVRVEKSQTTRATRVVNRPHRALGGTWKNVQRSTVAQRRERRLMTHAADHSGRAAKVKDGDTASGTETRDVRRSGRGLAGSDAGKPWRRCQDGWLVARGVMRTVTRSSSSKTAVGVSTEGLAAMPEKHSAARAWSTKQRPDRSRRRGQVRQRSCQPWCEQKFDETRAKWT